MLTVFIVCVFKEFNNIQMTWKLRVDLAHTIVPFKLIVNIKIDRIPSLDLYFYMFSSFSLLIMN